jgi:hypothetical protein
MNHLSENNYDGIVSELRNDLTEKAHLIYERVQKRIDPIKGVLIQPSSNALRRSVELIQVEGSPLFENKGHCSGASIWAIALFHAIKKNHPEIPAAKILAEIVKEFS